MIRYIEYLILIFFTYSFAGWFMESFGGIFKEKKLINRGFLIGPYCPVYGVGVVGITVMLSKYKNDIPTLFILAIVLCGSLEYFTSFIMEKLFNARWWDYHNRKFNINGRICLETLIPFGIFGTCTLCIFNPFLYTLFDKIPEMTLNIISIVLAIIFIIDFIISFYIIASFKNLTYSKKDNTEEISNKVKEKTNELGEKVLDKADELGEVVLDKAEDTLMKVESRAIHMHRKIKVRKLKIERKIRYTGKIITEKTTKPLKDLSYEIINKKDSIVKSISENKDKISGQIKASRKIITEQIVETFKKRSILSKRLMDAFPKVSIKNLIGEEDDEDNLQNK